MSDDSQEIKVHRWRGICLTDLQKGQPPVIKILRHSVTPSALTGPVLAGDTDQGVAYVDSTGVERQASVKTANYISATWLGDDINVYAPLVRIGEQVEVYQFSNANKFFWTSTGRDRHLRDVDRFRFEASAANGTGQEKTDDNSYSITADPIAGIFLQKTSKKLGELFSWTWGALTKRGLFIISDDKNYVDSDAGGDPTAKSTSKGVSNRIMIKSDTDTVMMNSAQKATVRLQGRDGLIDIPRDLQITAGRQIILDSPLITINLKQTGIVLINGERLGINATSLVTQVNTVGFSGDVAIGGTLVSGPIRSPLYANGKMQYSYQLPTIDVKKGAGTANAPAADKTIDVGSDRSATAWPEMMQAVEKICEELVKVGAKAGVAVDPSPIIALAQKSQFGTVFGEKT